MRLGTTMPLSKSHKGDIRRLSIEIGGSVRGLGLRVATVDGMSPIAVHSVQHRCHHVLCIR